MKVFVYTDGGSRGNPGVAGSGSVLIDASSKQVLAEIAYAFSEPTSNNVAEYRGLIEGLRAAVDLGADEAYVFMDSKLVVEQMSGRWKIKHPDMQKLALEARDLAAKLKAVNYTWIPRAQNKQADALSNVAMDASAKGAPEGIIGEKPVAAVPKAAEWCGGTSTPTRVVLVRHGQTDMSAAQQYAGLRDAELTDLGRRQVEAAAAAVSRREQIDLILTSPLRRCVATAEALAAAAGATVEVENGLIECDFGEYEGMTFAEAQERDPEGHRAWLGDPTLAPPGGESLADVYARVERTVGEIVDKHHGKTVALVSHVNPIKAILASALGAGEGMFPRLFLDLASVSVVDYLGEEAIVPVQVRRVNDTSFL
ncbi:bifunctional RNase H/acid phosphatase [Corynebacterium doosanense]|uniref:Acid phosphatase n=1 Tax=Corynebacterium doosanense CAU 212 = DSM 45436 TaxID=558173 RepID=A0A097IHC3_9CORY|nr:bifunctional RNase H/acid phosphatase [Corynebacterium doosanense]AIT61529.1 acid phosphatase [Corynebacterium doosanense CAU 212 = DSM 45436]